MTNKYDKILDDYREDDSTSVVSWGSITGTLANQTDLQAALNAKFSLPSLTTGSVLYFNGTTIAQDNANFFWDATNHNLTIGNKILVGDGSANAPTITFGGQTSTGFYRPGSAKIGVATGNQFLVNDGTALLPSLGFASDGTSGFYRAANPTQIGIVIGGAEKIRIDNSGNVGIGTTGPNAKLQVSGTTYFGDVGTSGAFRLYDASATGTGSFITFSNTLGSLTITGGNGSASTNNQLLLPLSVVVGSNQTLSFGSSGTATPDLIFQRDGVGILAQRNSTNPQTFNIYETYTDASNYERLTIKPSGAGGPFRIYTENAGTGVARALEFGTANGTVWGIQTSGHLFALTDNSYDIGATGANRPRNIYAGALFAQLGDVTTNSGGGLIMGSRSIIRSPADGKITISNQAITDFSLLQFGGTTSSFPALKRSSTTIAVRLADDSADAPISASSATFSAGIAFGAGSLFQSTGRAIMFSPTTSAWTFRNAGQTAGVRMDIPTDGTVQFLADAGGDTAILKTNIVNTTTGYQIGGAAASGKILRGDGTNYVASAYTMAVPGSSGNVLTSDGTNWLSSPASGAAHVGLTWVGGDATEHTTTSGTKVDLVTISGLSIAAGTRVLITGKFRKTSGAAAGGNLFLKINSTLITMPSTNGFVGTDATNENQDGIFEMVLEVGETNYQSTLWFKSIGYASSNGAWRYSSDSGAGTQNLGVLVPAATITSFVIQGSVGGAAAVTLGVKNVQVYTYGLS